MPISINLLPRKKSLTTKLWKALNVLVAVTTLLNVSSVAAWLQPSAAYAAESSGSSANITTVPPAVTPVANPALGQSCGLDIGLVVDTSGSVSSSEMTQMKTALTNFASAFVGTPTVFSLSSFNTNSTQNRAFSRTPAQIASDISTDIPAAGDGNTNWDSGLRRGYATFDPRAAKANLLVIATDGSPNRYGYPNATATFDWDLGLANAIPTANTIKGAGTRIVVVGIGEDDSDPASAAEKLEKMKAISGPSVATTPATITTTTDVIKVTDFAGIGAALSAYASQLCGGKILVQKQFDTNGDGVADLTGTTANALLSGYTFDVDGAPSNPAAQVTSSTGALEFSVLNGTYTVTETLLPAGTRVTSMQCVKGTQPIGSVNLQTATVSGLSLSTDETISCSVMNTYNAGSLKVTKVVNGGAATPDQFGFRLVGTNGAYVYPASNQNFVTFPNLLPGNYSVEETGPNDYHQANTTCTNIQVTAGQQASCTITNERDTGQLVVIKNVDTDGDGQADILGATDWTWNITGGEQHIATGQGRTVSTGFWTISEDQKPNYHVTNLTCNGQNLGAVESAQIQLTAQGVTCTFTNTRNTGTLRVKKIVINDNGGTATADDFSFRVNSGGAIAFEADGQNDLRVTTGTYSVVENSAAGYTTTYDACTNVNVTNGATVTCTITNNDQPGTLIVKKIVINDNGGTATADDFSFRVNSGAAIAFEADGQNDLTVPAGTYSVSENATPGYTATYASCANIVIPNGGTATCTITNNDAAATLVVYKYVVNDNGGTLSPADFILHVNGNSANPAMFLGSASGVPVSLNQGVYDVTEDYVPGYAPAFSADCTGKIAVGETKTCVVTNTAQAAHVVVIKNVVNDHGGTAVASDFTMTINGVVVPAGASFPGQSATGTDRIVYPGSYSVSETGPNGYAPSFSPDCVGTITLGQTKVCTVTNDDIQPRLTVTKIVINNNGGSATVQDFPLFANATPMVSGVQQGFSAGTYTISETNLPGYVGSFSGDCDTQGSVSLGLGETKSCVLTNDDVAADIAVEKDGPATVTAGENITYTITWNVQGPGFADNATLVDTLPNNATFVGATCGTTTGTCSLDTSTVGQVIWHLGDRPAPASGTVTVTVKTASPEIHGTLVRNSVLFTTDDDKDEDDHTTVVVSDFAVDLVKTDNVDPVAAGGTIVYTLAWSVTGNAPVHHLNIADVMPPNTTFVTASHSGAYDANTKTVQWDLGAKNPGETGSVTLTVKVVSPLPNGTVLLNRGTVCGQTFTRTQEEVIAHCDTDDETTTVTAAPVLSIVKSNNVAGFTNPGKTVTYTVVVSNATTATDTARSVALTDLLPTGFTFVEGGIGTKTFALGDIAPGASVTTSYTVIIATTQQAGTYTNTASAQGSNTPKVSATSNVEVRLPQILGASSSPELTITKRAAPTVTNPGKIITYTVIVKNIGDADAENVVVTDKLPKGFTFVDGGKTTKTWKLGTLEVNHERVLNYQVKVGAHVTAGKYTNVATVTADGMNEEARATVDVKVPKVLGLATTGVSRRDVAFFLLGLSLIAVGALWLDRQRRHAHLQA